MRDWMTRKWGNGGEIFDKVADALSIGLFFFLMFFIYGLYA